MAIVIKQMGDKWRVGITEEWEYGTFEELETELKHILAMKRSFGQLTRPQ